MRRRGTPHNHPARVKGCFRCDFGMTEAAEARADALPGVVEVEELEAAAAEAARLPAVLHDEWCRPPGKHCYCDAAERWRWMVDRNNRWITEMLAVIDSTWAAIRQVSE